eukprot:gene12986-14325_t
MEGSNGPDKEKSPWNLTFDERASLADTRKTIGNSFFVDGKLQEAFENYSAGIKLLIPVFDPEEAQLDTANSLKTSLYLNIAACQLKLKQYDYVICNCTKVLKIDQDNVKAFYRRAIAFTELNRLEDAQVDIRTGLKIDQNNAALKKLLHVVQMKIVEQNEKDGAFMKSYLKDLPINEDIDS